MYIIHCFLDDASLYEELILQDGDVFWMGTSG